MDDLPVVRVLGPLEVAGGNARALTRRQVRQVLALLATRPGEFFTTDELIEQLWMWDRPGHPRRSLQVTMSRAKAALGPCSNLLVAVSGGAYGLAKNATDLDLFQERFRQAESSGGKPSLELLDDMLGLWRGQPFGDCLGPPLLDEVAVVLRQQYRAALHCKAMLLTAEGRGVEAVAILEPIFDEDAGDEKIALALASALAELGRRRSAMDVLSTTRQVLRDTLGTDVLPEIRDLESSILLGTVEFAPWEQAPGTSPSRGNRSPFVGRVDELRRTLAAVERRGSIAIVGEPGIGKTRFVEALRSSLDLPVAAVSIEWAEPRPLHALSLMVEQFLDDSVSIPRDPVTREALRRVVPHRVAGEAPLAIGRDELVEAIAGFLQSAASWSQSVLVFDDVQNADELTLAVLRALAASRECPLVVTSRDPDAAAAIHATTESVSLHRLGHAEVKEYLALRYDDQRVPDSTFIERRSGGNPLFLAMLVDLDLEGALVDGEVPVSLLMAIQDRLGALSREVIETLQVAALIGTRFSLEVLRTLRPGADQHVEAATHAGLLTTVEGRPGLVGFTHGLVAEAAAQLLPVGRRVNLHDLVGRELASSGAPVTEFVSHFVQSSVLDPARAARACLASARSFAEVHQLGAASEHLRTGLAVLDEERMSTVPDAIELAIELSRVQRLQGDPAHFETARRAARLASEHGSDDQLGRAAVELSSHGVTTLYGQAHRDALDVVELALRGDLADETRARLEAAASTLMAFSTHYARGQQLFKSAWSLAESVGEPSLVGNVLAHSHLGLGDPDDHELRSMARASLSEVCGRNVDLRWEAAYLEFWHGIVNVDIEVLEAGIATVRSLTPLATHRTIAGIHVEVAYAHLLGRDDLAEAELLRAAEVAAGSFSTSWARAHFNSIMFAIRLQQGRLSELAGGSLKPMDEMAEVTNWQVARAWIALEAGSASLPARTLEDLGADGFGGLARDITWTGAVFGLARIAVALGDRVRSRQLYRLLAPHAERMAWVGTCSLAPNAGVLAELAELCGDAEMAALHRAQSEAIEGRLAAAVHLPRPDQS